MMRLLLARVGPIDMRAQAVVPNARRTDTPTHDVLTTTAGGTHLSQHLAVAGSPTASGTWRLSAFEQSTHALNPYSAGADKLWRRPSEDTLPNNRRKPARPNVLETFL